jgi:hypothetical protein
MILTGNCILPGLEDNVMLIHPGQESEGYGICSTYACTNIEAIRFHIYSKGIGKPSRESERT